MSENLLKEIEQARQEIKRLKISLRAEELRTKISSEYTNFGLWEYDISTDICYQYKKMDGKYQNNLEPIVRFRDTVIGWGTICMEDMPVFNRFCDALARGDKEISCELRVVNDDGDIALWRYEGKTVFDEEGTPLKVVGRTIDITRGGNAEERQKNASDAMPGVYSLDAFRECAAEKRAGASRYKNAALLSVGIDDFRMLAAEFGEKYSEHIQQTVAKLLNGVGSSERDALLTRVRDGEFLLYLSCANLNALDETAKRIIGVVRDHANAKKPVSVSVGISLMKSARKLKDVYGESSAALGEAQRSGGACYMHYTPNMSLRAFEKSADFGEEFGGISLSSGAAKVYDLIVSAFCDEKNRASLLKAAFKSAGQCVGASSILVYHRSSDGFIPYMTYSAVDGLPEEARPCLEQKCSDDELCAAFGSGSRLRVHSASDEFGGLLELRNGAVCAECRAIRRGGEIAEYFVVVFDGSFELSEQDMHIIGALENALTEIYRAYADGKAGQMRKRFRSTILSNHRIEGFSIVPGTFVIDFVGDNASDHYNLSCGDVCYKKMRGRDEPCVNCPALQLDCTDSMFASSAYYCESDRRWLDITASVEINENGERRYIVSYTDITDCLGKIQTADLLTGVMTFDVFTAEALRLTSPGISEDAGNFVTVINVAEFRRINEAKGFELGNAILIAIADILQRCIRQGELLCRSEGSRFVALFKNTDYSDFEQRINMLINSIQKQIYEKLQTQIYLLVGACDMNDEPVGVMGALDRAIIAQNTVRDRTYYHENLLVFYDGALRDKIKERRHIEANMLSALENDEFKVYYQPKVNIATGRVVGAEALVRWIRPDGEIISPGRFVPIFEENGFITDMDFVIYRKAITDIARWLSLGIDVPLISLNVSRHHISDDNFGERLNSLVDSLNVPHELIELEITESLLMENLDMLVDTVTWFKDKGFRISIDDFGSGYSSLNLITMLPFDTLKIDGGFFLKNDLTDKNKKVISSVVTLAKSLNLKTVSEGVETQRQVDFLKDLGCDMIQGFFYYKPMPGDDFESILAAQSGRFAEKPAEQVT